MHSSLRQTACSPAPAAPTAAQHTLHAVRHLLRCALRCCRCRRRDYCCCRCCRYQSHHHCARAAAVPKHSKQQNSAVGLCDAGAAMQMTHSPPAPAAAALVVAVWRRRRHPCHPYLPALAGLQLHPDCPAALLRLMIGHAAAAAAAAPVWSGEPQHRAMVQQAQPTHAAPLSTRYCCGALCSLLCCCCCCC